MSNGAAMAIANGRTGLPLRHYVGPSLRDASKWWLLRAPTLRL